MGVCCLDAKGYHNYPSDDPWSMESRKLLNIYLNMSGYISIFLTLVNLI